MVRQELGAPQAGPVQAAYEALVGRGALRPDPAQAEAVLLLQAIADAVDSNERQRRGLLGRRAPVKGAYLWGEVGRGKTQLMDLFFAAAPVAAKRRIHFHGFMDEVHEAIRAFRAGRKPGPGRRDPVPEVARRVAGSLRLLCLDEFHVNDITNAMLLDRLFGTLFDQGLVLVATSNVAPDGLYPNGLNRSLFLPFIARLKREVTVFELNAATDYRLEKLAGQTMFHFDTGKAAMAAMDRLWAVVAGGEPGEMGSVSSLGREIVVPRQAMEAARFDFADLCETPLGARDYLRIAEAFETLIIDNVPQFDRTRSNAAKRFILLIDTLYDRGVKLGASFAVPLDRLEGDQDTAFEFARTRSRLIEMQSAAYLGAPPREVAE